jgi:5-methylcytosine-specific restriction endonuclease McrA
MRANRLSQVGDTELVHNLAAIVARDCGTTAEMLEHLAEMEVRRLYLPAGYPSMSAYCINVFHMSEDMAYKRIGAARAAREFPAIIDLVASGRLHLTAVVLLRSSLTQENADELLQAATHKTKAEIEQLLAERFPQPDVPTVLQAIVATPATPNPELTAIEVPADMPVFTQGVPQQVPEPVERPAAAPIQPHAPTPAPRPRLKPLAPERFALQVTISESTHDKLRHVQELLSHAVPSGDLAQVLDRALDALIGQLEKSKFGATDRPRTGRQGKSTNKRCIPARVKREVWERDQGQCTFVGDTGRRCEARKLVEYDHVDPIARGGIATVDSIRLRCRAHNQLEAERAYGDGFMHEKRETARRARAMSATPVPPSGSPARA